MKLKQFVKLLMSVLFLLVSQSHAVHSGLHAIDKVEECYSCETSNHIDTKHHEVQLSNFFVSYNEESFEVEQCNFFNEPIDLEQQVEQKRILIVGIKSLEVSSLPLGFDAIAPPKNF